MVLSGPHNGGVTGEPLRQSVAKRMARDGRVEELRGLARAGDSQAARFAMQYLARVGRVEELWELAGGGDRAARWALADWLVRRRRVAEAIEVMRPLAAASIPGAQRRLARLLGGQGRYVEAMAELAMAPPHHDDVKRVRGWLDARGMVDRSCSPLARYVSSRPSEPELRWVVLLAWHQEPDLAVAVLDRVAWPDEWLRHRLLWTLAGSYQDAARARAIDVLARRDAAARLWLV